MALDVDNYEGVETDEEKPKASPYEMYPPVVPQAPPAAPPVAPQLEAPAAPPAALSAPETGPALPRRPQPSDYPAAEPHGWRKGLGLLSIGMGAMTPHHPEVGDQIEHQVFEAPRERAQKAYQAAAGAYDTELNQGLAQRKEQRERASEESQAKLREKQGEQYEKVPVVVNGQTFYIPQKDAEKLIGTGVTAAAGQKKEETRVKSAEDIEKERTASAEKIAKERTESAERITTGHNLTATEVARIRAAAANDPNKLTNTMKTMKQQAQATLPGIDRALDETEKVAGLLGPGEGRWNDLMTNKLGAENPAYKHYYDEIGMVQSAVTLAHARGRMSNELFEHFEKMFDAGKQAPANMIQALNVAKEWLTDYSTMGEGAGGGATPAAPGASATNTIPTFKEFVAKKPKKP
jgi:hypothetical protein